MAYTTTTKLSLQKAVPGTNQAFETTSINSNWDKVDAEAVAIDVRIDAHDVSIAALQTLTTSGTVNAATTATNATNATTATNALKIDGRKVSVASTAPSSPTSGDIWIQI